MRYPKTARKDRIEGRVIVSFIVAKTGVVQSVSILESVRRDIDEEAMRVIRGLEAWNTVNVAFSLPIQFKL